MSPLTELLRQCLACPADSLGLQPERLHTGQAHYHADLNYPESPPPELHDYDVIVFAEVIEHLYTSHVAKADSIHIA
jgi:hypothetical protein